MKQGNKIVILAVLMVLAIPVVCMGKGPKEIAGIVLGENTDNYTLRLEMTTAQPIRHMPYLSEVKIKKTPGFKSGVIWQTTSTSPGRIVRIKLKYNDPSRKFFDRLLSEFKTRFGKPTEWRGDCFGNFIAWKWSFKDTDGKRISMIVQHNIKDQNQKMGNNLKLTMWDLIDSERNLHEQGKGKEIEEESVVIQPMDIKPEELERLVPR